MAMNLELRGVRRRFDLRDGHVLEALDRTDLVVWAGEFVCLIGPSGCGKSTLLNLLAGLDKPTEGEILMDGNPVTGPGPDRAVLFQELALFPWMSVRRNVEFALKLIGVSKPERQERANHW